MNKHNTQYNFGSVSRFIHTLYALLFFGLIASALIEQNIAEGSPYLVNLHSSIGILAILLVIVRLIWIKKSGKPDALGTPAEKLMAKSSYAFLVMTMIVMPFSGLMLVMAKAREIDFFGLFSISGFAERSPELINIASLTHEYLAYFSYLLILGHVVGTLAHHFITKDTTFTRMFGAEAKGEKS